MEPEAVPKLIASGTIEVAPLAYMRGRTLNESFVILDDDSDMLPEQMNNFIHVDGQVGLTDRDVLTAIEILNR